MLFDEPREFMRMWSTPVHRWLSAHVHLPTMALARTWTSNGRTNNNTKAASPQEVTSAGKPTARYSTLTTWLPAVVATCVVSGVYHEAVVYVAMRGTCWPFNTFLLCVAGVLIMTWDVVFRVRTKNPDPEQAKNGEKQEGINTTDSDAVGGGGGSKVKMVRAYGERGMVSVVMFNVLVQLSAFIADGAAWLWWRHLHVKD